jgi:two-component sensor histidine kinase
LIPTAVKCLVLPNPKGYVLLGILALSYWGFLAALIAKITREIGERKKADVALEESEAGLQEAVATVARRTREDSRSTDEFLQVFDGRIQSMANAHRLLSRSHWQGVSLADLVRKELAPCAGEGSASAEGPEVLLSPEATQSVAIVLHELVTNASKYGALATKHGRITVRWDWQRDGQAPRRLLLEWVERGGSPVILPGRAGYGTDAIRNLIPYELGGVVDLAFDAAGVRCRIELPSSALA